jgi:GNAT superfamily N-acetyltransferase
MKIRKATINDASSIMNLIKELAVFEKEPEAVEVTVADLERDGFGEHPLFNCFVAELDAKIVGIALYYYRYSTWKGKTIHLEDLIVNQEYRGKNIGTMLYNEIMLEAQRQKVRRVEWAVLDWNTPAIKFYEKSGAVISNEWRVAQMDQKGIANFVNIN